MRKSKIIGTALINSVLTSIYIIIIGLLLQLGSSGILKNINEIFAPIIMLMLFVFSAALTGILILGKPIIWYLNNKKKEAWYLLFCTLGFFLIILLIIILLIVFIF